MCRYTVKTRLVDCEVANKTLQRDTSRGKRGIESDDARKMKYYGKIIYLNLYIYLFI